MVDRAVVDSFQGKVKELLLAIKTSRITGLPLWRFSRHEEQKRNTLRQQRAV